MINGESYFIIDYLKRFVYQPIEVDYVVVNGGRSQSFYEAVLPKINYKKLLNSTKSEYKLNKALVN